MKTSSKIIRPIVFFLIVLLCFLMLSYIFAPKDNSKEAGMYQSTAYGFLGEDKDTIDVMFIGDSEAYYSFIPMQIYNKYGYTSYVGANPSQRVYEGYYIIKKAIEKQDLKVVFFETNSLYRNSNFVQSAKGMVKIVLPYLIYHNRWKTLNINDFFSKIEYTWIDENKGYRFKNDIEPSTKIDYMKIDGMVKEIPNDNIYWFDKLKELCEENDIKLILVSNPSTKNWSYAKSKGMEKFAQDRNLEFIDFNLSRKVSIDWNHDTPDKGDHINYYGAKKITNYIADYLKELDILEDHRDDEKYKSYNEALIKYLENKEMD